MKKNIDMNNKQIMFDVGAHVGQSSIYKAKENSNLYVYAFEPIPELVQIIINNSVELDNYIIIPKAVSDYNGQASFNVRGVGDWGHGSLSEFTENVDSVWPTDSLRFTDKIEVEVVRLDTFIESNNIKRIDYLHIDAQGNDLKVLKSLGKYLSIVREGVVEASNPDKIYYVDQNIIDDTVAFLEESEFEIILIDPNDNLNNEFNIHFKKI